MQSMPSKSLLHLIEGMERGEISPAQAAQKLASSHVAAKEQYAQTLVLGGLLTLGAWAATGGSFILPAVVAYLTWDSFDQSRKDRLAALRAINEGKVLQYLPDFEREMFANVEELMEQSPKAIAPVPTAEIEVQTPPVEPPTVTPPAPVSPPAPVEVGDVAKLLSHRLKPTIITARPRVGKGMVVAQALQQAKQLHGSTVWVIQPKPANHELAYWKSADRFLGFWAEKTPPNDQDIADQLSEFVMQWRQQCDRPTILLIDELVMLESVMPKWYKDFLLGQIKVEGSSGETDRRYLWLITQSPQVKDLGLSGGNRSMFDILTVQRSETIDHAASLQASIASFNSVPGIVDFRRSPVGASCWHSASRQWMPVPKYDLPMVGPNETICCELAGWMPAKAGAALSAGAGAGLHQIVQGCTDDFAGGAAPCSPSSRGFEVIDTFNVAPAPAPHISPKNGGAARDFAGEGAGAGLEKAAQVWVLMVHAGLKKQAAIKVIYGADSGKAYTAAKVEVDAYLETHPLDQDGGPDA